jgi:hypothetical protein
MRTYWVPGMVRLRPFRTREVFFPPTTAIGDTNVNSGVFQVLHDFDRRVIPERKKGKIHQQRGGDK